MLNIIPMKPNLVAEREATPEAARPRAQVIAITSGKGGVGKTNITGNLAVALAQRGERVCILDADTSLANVNLIMGVTPRHTLEHLLRGECDLDGLLTEGPGGVAIVPAASDAARLGELDEDARARLRAAIQTLEAHFDFILIDTAAGISASVLSLVRSAQHTIVVISPEPASLTDAFALLRALRREAHDRPAHVLVNLARNYANSMEVYKRFEGAVRKYLGARVHYLGYITDDDAVRAAVTDRQPVVLSSPAALASRCFTTLAAVIDRQFSGSAAAEPEGKAWWAALAGTDTKMETRPAVPAPPSPAEGALREPEETGPPDAGGRPGISAAAAGAGVTSIQPEANPPADGNARATGAAPSGADDDVAPCPAPFLEAEAPADGGGKPHPAPTPLSGRDGASAPASVVASAAEAVSRELGDLLAGDDFPVQDARAVLGSLVERIAERLPSVPLTIAAIDCCLGSLESQPDAGREDFQRWAERLETAFARRFGEPLYPPPPEPPMALAERGVAADPRDDLLQHYRSIAARLAAKEADLEEMLQRLCDAVSRQVP